MCSLLQSAEYSGVAERRVAGSSFLQGLIPAACGCGPVLGDSRIADAIGRRRELIQLRHYIAGGVLEVAPGAGRRAAVQRRSSVASSTAPGAASRCMGLPRTSPRCRQRPYGDTRL